MDEHPDLVRLRLRTRSRVADIISTVTDPLVLVSATLVAVAVAVSPSVLAGLGWAAVPVLFCAIVPEVALRLVMRTQGNGDRQLVVREQRRVPLLVSVASVLVGVFVLVVADAPTAVTALVVTVLAGVTVMAAVTRVWKASVHAAVAASMTVVLATVFGSGMLLGCLPVVAAVAWARVRAGRHDVAQVLVGGLIGALTATVFPWLS